MADFPLVQKRVTIPVQPIQEETVVLAESKTSGGMNTYIDPSDIPSDSFVLVRNAAVQADKLLRARGTTKHGPTKPDSNPILQFVQFKDFDGTTTYYRFTKNKVYRRGSSYVEVTSSDPYDIIDNSRPMFCIQNNRLFFAPGRSPIQEIDFSNDTYADLGNAPPYKFITGFFNRLVGANLYDSSNPNPTLLGWSGDLNFGEWDPLVDNSAGSTPLLEGATDFADPITGLFGFASVMLILRERSLWTATKRGVASNPLIFQAAFPFAGCDSPYTAAQKRNGIVWYDYRSNQVYDYDLGGTPQEIGDAVRLTIQKRIQDKELISGGYDPILNEYHLVCPSNTAALTYIYVYSFEVGSWRERTILNAYGMYGLDGAPSGLMIDDLAGFIDGLQGMINDLVGGEASIASGVFYGMKDGEIFFENFDDTTDDGVELLMRLESKIIRLPVNDYAVSRLAIVVRPLREGSIKMLYSKNGGTTWHEYKTVTFDASTVGERRKISCPRQIRATSFMWALESAVGNFEILEYVVEATASPFTKPYPK